MGGKGKKGKKGKKGEMGRNTFYAPPYEPDYSI